MFEQFKHNRVLGLRMISRLLKLWDRMLLVEVTFWIEAKVLTQSIDVFVKDTYIAQ